MYAIVLSKIFSYPQNPSGGTNSHLTLSKWKFNSLATLPRASKYTAIFSCAVTGGAVLNATVRRTTLRTTFRA